MSVSLNPQNANDLLIFAHMAEDSYAGSGGSTVINRPPSGWAVFASDAILAGAPGGFQATAYRNNANNEIVIAYRGTDEPGELANTSIPLGMGLSESGTGAATVAAAAGSVSTTSYAQASFDFFTAVQALSGNALSDIGFVGHSLGGIVAGYMGVLTGETAVTFASGPHSELFEVIDAEIDKSAFPGLPPVTDLSDAANQNVYNVRVDGEVLQAAVSAAQIGALTGFVGALLTGNAALATALGALSFEYAGARRIGDFATELDAGNEFTQIFEIDAIDLHAMQLHMLLHHGDNVLSLDDDYKETKGFLEAFYDDDLAAAIDQRFDPTNGRGASQAFSDIVLTATSDRPDVLTPLLQDADQKLFLAEAANHGDLEPIVFESEVPRYLSEIAIEHAALAAAPNQSDRSYGNIFNATADGEWLITDFDTVTFSGVRPDGSTGDTTPYGFYELNADGIETGLLGEVLTHYNQAPVRLFGTQVDSLVTYIGADNDAQVNANPTTSAFVLGGDAEDTITGSNQNDVLFGNDDSDVLFGAAGNDVLIGGDGTDSLSGGTGFDIAVYSGAVTEYEFDFTARTINGPGFFDEDDYDSVELATFDDGLVALETISFSDLQAGLGFTSLSETAEFIIESEIGADVTNVNYAGAGEAGFLISDFSIPGAIDEVGGFFLSTGGLPGDVNTSPSFTIVHGTAGDTDLSASAVQAFSGSGTTNDASVIEFTLDVADDVTDGISFDLVFGSDEFPEFSNSSFVDIAAVYVNGDNVALFNDNPTTPLSVIDGNLAGGNFIDNTANAFATEWDGFSNRLTVRADLQSGSNTIKIGIADTGDSSFDSGLYVNNIELLTEGGTGGGVLTILDGDDGDNTLNPSENNEEINLFGGSDTVAGSSAQLNGDIITNFGDDDLLVVTGASFGDEDITVTLGSAILDIDTDGDGIADTTITLAGDFEGATFQTNQNSGGTEISATFPGSTVFGVEGVDDILNGTPGNDTFNGRSGADTMTGFEGDDRYIVDDPGDVVIEALNGGRDIFTSKISNVLPDNIEVGSLSGIDDLTLVGNELANTISGNSGNNDLLGAGGGDRLRGGEGDDTLTGGEGNDLLEGQVGADVFVITANNGDDQVLDWEAGTDVLDFDTLGFRFVNLAILSSGNEALITFDDPAGGTGSVRLIDIDPAALNSSIMTNPGGIGSEGGIALLEGTTASENIAGSAAGEDIVGLAGNDTLNGRAGDDTMVGGFGNDRYLLDDAGDIAIEQAFQGIDQVDTRFDLVLQDHIENAAVRGGGAVNITGNDLNNFITGSDLSNVLSGGDGRDRLIARAGDDTLDGGLDRDVLEGGAGSDVFVFEADSDVDLITDFTVGEDLLDVSALGIAFADMTIVDGALGALVIFDAAPGSVDLVTLQGVSAADVRQASFIGAPNLPIIGTEGNDVLRGTVEDDELQGLGGEDRLDGLGGADTLIGGLGDDRYFVDDANDVVTELAGEGTDLVSSLVDFTLPEHVENGSALGTGDVDLTGNGLANALTGNDASNVLTGLAGADNLQGKGGADTINGGQGLDVLRGGAGADTFVFALGDGPDQILDFEINIDIIDFSATGLAFGDLIIGDSGANAIVSYGADVLTVVNVIAADLDTNQFEF